MHVGIYRSRVLRSRIWRNLKGKRRVKVRVEMRAHAYSGVDRRVKARNYETLVKMVVCLNRVGATHQKNTLKTLMKILTTLIKQVNPTWWMHYQLTQIWKGRSLKKWMQNSSKKSVFKKLSITPRRSNTVSSLQYIPPPEEINKQVEPTNSLKRLPRMIPHKRINRFLWRNITWSGLWLSFKTARLPLGKSSKICVYRLKKPLTPNSQLIGFILSNNTEQLIITSMNLHSLIVNNYIEGRGVEFQIYWIIK